MSKDNKLQKLSKKKCFELRRILPILEKTRDKHYNLSRKLSNQIEDIDKSTQKLWGVERTVLFILGKRKGEPCQVRKIKIEDVMTRKNPKKHMNITYHACSCDKWLRWELAQDFYIRCERCKIPPKDRITQATFARTFDQPQGTREY